MPGEGKSDMDRIGLFSEMGYISIGDQYVNAYNRPFNEAASKNRQMIPGGSKLKAATQAGYFDSQFMRIYENEGYSDPAKLRRQFRMQESKRNVGKAFLPSNGEKMRSGLGSYYGTIGGPVSAFSAELKGKEPYTAPGKNFYTNPPKHGTGYGYPGLTIGKQYENSIENYDIVKEMMKADNENHKKLLKGGPFKLNLYPREYFDVNPYQLDRPLPPLKTLEGKVKVIQPFKPSSPAKEPGGMKAGTFEPYPTHSEEPYRPALTRVDTGVKEGGRLFQPPTGAKSRPVHSILAAHVVKSLTPMNYKTVHLSSY
ncbi:cilia-and flagella-associated protein 96 [Ambystoma mexicanum]|uniref:cilia-and flagella-associated protein 96 n=1 Tax=Ambystoma mexicanum TaxID=8296 RepID=UPI0037E8F400